MGSIRKQLVPKEYPHHMPWQPQKAYLEAEILTASPVRLTEILMDLLVTSIENARECCRTGDVLARSRFVNKAFEVLVELMDTLNFEEGQDLAHNYARLYDYSQKRLLQAHVEQSEPMLAEVQSLLSEMRDAWRAVVTNCSPKCLIEEELNREEFRSGETEPRFSYIG